MCGIAGIMTRSGAPADPDALDRLQAALAHRGPDGSGRLSRGRVGLVHLRLAIVDLNTGDQPLLTPRGTALIGNGEIYNDPDLRRAMPDTPFRTRSDCEPAVFLYDRDGVGFADALRGMYALAIHDLARDRLVLARDPFGIKPLYYVATGELFAFASEPQALIRAGLARAAIGGRVRAELLQLKFSAGAETIFPGIFRVLPGETLVVERGRIVDRRRRAALPAGAPISVPDPIASLDRVLADSVSAHLRSDVPYGLFLSGGIDSASLLVLMARLTGQRIRALTMGWDTPDGVDESREAERLAKVVGAECHRLTMGEREFWSLAPRIVACMDDPAADGAVLPSWLLGRAARADGLKVTLCGEGADELFAGYSRYRKRRAPWRWFARKPRAKTLFDVDMPGWRDGIIAAETAIAPDRTELQAAQEVDVAEWLPNDLMIKLDRTLMVHGVEGRTPFLDPSVADLAFRLPDRMRAGRRFGKVLLRTWLAQAFPEAGAFARKKGFRPPLGVWMEKRGETLARLVAAQPGVSEVVPREVVSAAFNGAARDPQPAWSLLFYALWHQHHIVGRDPAGDIAEVLS